MSIIIGNNRNNNLNGTAGADIVIGGNGNDTINGGAGCDLLLGGNGRDTINGDGGNDMILAGNGDDVADGGAGSDRVELGAGNDVAVYRMSENTGAHDVYDGGSGFDTLRLELTRDEWLNLAVQSDIERFVAFLALNESHGGGHRGHHHHHHDRDFDFSAFNLEAEKFEALQVFVDGAEVSAQDDAVDAADDSYAVGEDATVAGQVLDNDSVPDLVRSVDLIFGPAEGALVFNADGSFVYDPEGAFDALGEGESATVTFSYQVTDADLDTDTATATITVNGANDAPVIAVAAGDSDTATLTETDAGLSAAGTLTVTDVDLSDTVTTTVTGVALSGTTGGLTEADVLAFLTAASGAIDADAGDANNLAWSFDSGAQAFDFLNDGESLTLTYAVEVSDGHGGSDSRAVAVTIDGTADHGLGNLLAVAYTNRDGIDGFDPSADVFIAGLFDTNSDATASAGDTLRLESFPLDLSNPAANMGEFLLKDFTVISPVTLGYFDNQERTITGNAVASDGDAFLFHFTAPTATSLLREAFVMQNDELTARAVLLDNANSLNQDGVYVAGGFADPQTQTNLLDIYPTSIGDRPFLDVDIFI